jgi:hypothetical protein
MRQIYDRKYNCFPRNHHDAAPNNCRHSEDFENAGVIFGAGKTWRMGADFQRATKHIIGSRVLRRNSGLQPALSPAGCKPAARIRLKA